MDKQIDLILPKSISIRGQKWIVKQLTLVQDQDHRRCLGIACDVTKTIEIDKTLKPLEKFETFLHEYGHALSFELGFHDEEVPSWVEHMFVIALSKDMVINCRLFKTLFEEAVQCKR